MPGALAEKNNIGLGAETFLASMMPGIYIYLIL